MKKKIKDITIEDMINVCDRNKNTPCYNCVLVKICGIIPYDLKCNEDPNKEIDL